MTCRPPPYTPWATALQANGYNTGLVGKWHIQSQPQGFDYYSIFFDQGEYRDPTFIESTDPWPGNRRFGERVPGFSTDLVTEKAIKWIKTAGRQAAFHDVLPLQGDPRALRLSDTHGAPLRRSHLPRTGKPSRLGAGNQRAFFRRPRHSKNWNAAGALPRKTPTNGGAVIPDCHSAPKACNGPLPRKAAYQKFIRDYMRCGATVDDNIGKLLKTLDEMGIADNTIVVYVSDQEIYYRYWTNHAIRPAHFAIRSDRYKLIFYYARNLDMTDTENFDFTPSWDFYDLQNDPHENHNAYNDPKYAPVIKQMKKDMLNLRKEVGDTDEKYPEMQELLEKYYYK